MAARLKEVYQKEVAPALAEEFKYASVMQVPRVTKVVANIGVGEAIQNAKSLDAALADLAAICGQKPVVTRARKSIAGFKLRQGMPIGAMVTLRGDRMYDFLDRLINLALPRIRDFRGISRRSFDGRGNYSLGLREQILFPEIEYDKVDKIRGLEVAIVTTALDDAQGYSLLRRFGMPFRD
jgi:large subunit ribosomal protein L5